MNSLMKRFGAGLMALVLVLSLFVGALPTDVFAASITYSTLSNSGTRDEICTSLDGTGASSYYTSSYTFETLSEQNSNQLLQSLRTLMTSTQSYISSYDDCHYLADRTDCENGNGKVVLLYTSYSATMSEWNGWNREHVWPQSLGGGNTSGGGADLHHVRPSDAVVNSTRGNKKYGNADGGTAVNGKNPATGYLGGHYSGDYYEPLDNVKGDVARICLYVYVRWGSAWGADSITEVFQSVDVLLEWMEIDPVDTWEMGRNEVVEDIQGNRNVFIDYPEYAWLLFGKEVPEDYNTPSNSFATSKCDECNYKATVTAATCTTAGYTTYVCTVCNHKYTSDTIDALGHTWTAATCTAPKTCSVCKATEGTTADHTDDNGDNICDVCSADMSTTTPPVITDGSYVKITSADQLTTGQYVLINEKEYAPLIFDNSTNTTWLTAVKPTVSNGVVTDTKGAIWTLTVSSDGVTMMDSNGVYIAPGSGNNNGLKSDSYKWNFVFSNGTFTIQGTGNDTTRLASNTSSQYKFRAYKNTTVSSQSYPSNFTLYKLVESTSECDHSYDDGVVTTAPTCTTDGIKTFTCSACGDSYTETITATGHMDSNSDNSCDTCGQSMGTQPETPTTGNTYVKVTENLSDWSGTYLIVYEDKAYAFDGSLTTLDSENDYRSVTIVNDTITLTADDTKNGEFYFTIKAVDGGYSIQSASGCYIGQTTYANGFSKDFTTPHVNSISYNATSKITEVAMSTSSGKVTLRFNAASNQMRFRYYKSGQQPIALYRLTTPVHTHSHNATVTAPTCTTPGYTTYTCACGDSYTGNEVPATGHNWTDANCITPKTCSVCGTTEGGLGDHNVVSGICTVCQRYGTCGENLTWTLDEEGTLTISGTGNTYDYSFDFVPWDGIKDTLKNVIIESGVTDIGGGMFSHHKNLVSISIPDSVTSIRDWAFVGCTSLTSIFIPSSVSYICSDAFTLTDSLHSIQVAANNPYFLADDRGVLYTKDMTELIAAPGAFTGTYVIPEGVTLIWSDAFSQRLGLTNITIPDSVINIGREAFWGCTGLTNVDIGNGIVSVGYLAFEQCSNLAYNVYNNAKYLGNEQTPYLLLMETVNENIFACTIHEQTKIIYDDAFRSCPNLTSISIPDNVVSIGSYAFAQNGLANVTIGRGVSIIGASMFYQCNDLKNVFIPNTITDIGHSAFGYCENLTNVIYCGTEEQWSQIAIAKGNEPVINATRNYHDFVGGNCTTPATCTICGATDSAALGHNYIDGVCDVCGDKEVVEHEHSYEYVDNGNNTHDKVCSCGDVAIDNELHSYNAEHACACGHTLFEMKSGSSATLEAMLQLDFIINPEQMTGTDNYAILTRTYADGPNKGTVDQIRIDQADWSDYSNNRKAASYTKIAAKEMGDEVTIVLYNAQGQQLSVPKTDSIKGYAYRGLTALANTSNEKNIMLRTTLADMLNYGAAAQVFFKYDAEKLVNAEMTATQQSWATAEEVATSNNADSGLGGRSRTLTLESAIQLDFIFYANVVGAESEWANRYAIATYEDHYGKTKTVRVEGKDFIRYGSTTDVQVSVVGMAVADYQSIVTCVVYNSEGEEVGRSVDSIEGYANRATNAASASETLKDVLKTLMKFGAAADAYF